jgi:hypothetical protein
MPFGHALSVTIHTVFRVAEQVAVHTNRCHTGDKVQVNLTRTSTVCCGGAAEPYTSGERTGTKPKLASPQDEGDVW